mgnify:CR=1 FL=1
MAKEVFIPVQARRGLFSDEYIVEIKLKGETIVLFVDKELVRIEGQEPGEDAVSALLSVEILREEGDQVTVVLPQQPLSHSSSITVPKQWVKAA